MNIVDRIIIDPITKGLKFLGRNGQSVFSTSPQGMSDELATQLGMKYYFHGTSYKGGIGPTITFPGQSSVTVNYGLFIPYQMQDGSWRVKGSFKGSFTGTSGGITASVVGITTANYGPEQPCYAGLPAAGAFYYALANSGASSNQFFAAPGTTTSGIYFGFDVSLASKPTWAY